MPISIQFINLFFPHNLMTLQRDRERERERRDSERESFQLFLLPAWASLLLLLLLLMLLLLLPGCFLLAHWHALPIHTHTRAHAHTKWATPADEEKGRKATANSLLLFLPRLKWCVVVVAFIIDVATKKSLRGGATWCQVVAKLIKLTRSYHKFV